MDIISRLLGRRQGSRETARQRLRLVLVHDRSGIPPELLDVIKSDIITVISARWQGCWRMRRSPTTTA